MSTNIELTALQNFADKFNLKVKLFFEQDKRKKTKFILTKEDLSISPGLNYNQMNHFLLGMNSCKKNNINYKKQ